MVHPDYDRPLTERGGEDAHLMGAWLSQQIDNLDYVLCSSALRTKETWKQCQEFFPNLEAKFDDSLYNAQEHVIQEAIRNAPAHVESILVIGHNPGMLACVYSLGFVKSSYPVTEGFPTAAIAILRVHGEWNELSQENTEIIIFKKPEKIRNRRIQAN
jgi:phosphohistidine phosphatase